MFVFLSSSSQWITKMFSRSYSSKHRISPQFRFYMDTYAVYGTQHNVPKAKASKPSELNLFQGSTPKNIFDSDTEALYGGPSGFYRARSVPKGVSISERKKHLRELFRIPRGHRISSYSQAYIPNIYLGLRKKNVK
ncbi:unnamed protein product [Adineta ricciae]|uniref:Uncharacterized protein n=1 Tax=Adineta ricciae TaxID=249248 RepID=A0A814CWG3_ADIRI|nr:unnamed protein product [Adineta ricciae]